MYLMCKVSLNRPAGSDSYPESVV